MKTLFLVRHAKSSWDNPDLDDFHRPLNERGVRDAPRMGKRLKEREITPGIILSSPAVRAVTTCEVVIQILGCALSQIKIEKRIYHASEDEMYAIVGEIPDKHESAMIFGHNPGFTDFANSLTDEFIQNVPTCGVVCVRSEIKSWGDIQPGCGKLEFFDFPKKNQGVN